MNRRIVFALAATLAVVGCSQPTPSQPPSHTQILIPFDTADLAEPISPPIAQPGETPALLTVADARTSPSGLPVLVTGWLVLRDDDAVLCDDLDSGHAAPTCVDPVSVVGEFDTEALGLTWDDDAWVGEVTGSLNMLTDGGTGLLQFPDNA